QNLFSLVVSWKVNCLSATLPHFSCFFFHHTPTTEIYTLSLHDALPISLHRHAVRRDQGRDRKQPGRGHALGHHAVHRRSQRACRSEEHTSELQSPYDLVCRLLLEKKKHTTSLHERITTHAEMISCCYNS